jgi:hypothetical protein
MKDESEQPMLFRVEERKREERVRARRDDPLKTEIVALCRINPIAYGGWARIEKEIAPLRRAGASPEQVHRFGFWYAHVFWGDAEQYPKVIPTVLKHWGQFEIWDRSKDPTADLSPEQVDILKRRYLKGD